MNNTYTFQVGNVKYGLVSKSKVKARAYLKAISYASDPIYLGKNLSLKPGDFSTIGVIVPDNYITPKQHAIKLLRADYNQGIIDAETYEHDLRLIKAWKN